MPAEWAAHAATWLAWPHYHVDWPGKFDPVPWVYAEIIRWLGEADITSRRLIEQILKEEEDHADELNDLFEG